MIKPLVISIAAIIFCFGVMDAIWLGIIATETYQQEMQNMLRSEYPIWPWFTFYLLYAVCIAALAVQPSFNSLLAKNVKRKQIAVVAFRGLLLGLASYGAYNLTNYAILQNWSLKITLIDWAWGCVVTSSSAAFAALIVSKVKIKNTYD